MTQAAVCLLICPHLRGQRRRAKALAKCGSWGAGVQAAAAQGPHAMPASIPSFEKHDSPSGAREETGKRYPRRVDGSERLSQVAAVWAQQTHDMLQEAAAEGCARPILLHLRVAAHPV